MTALSLMEVPNYGIPAFGFIHLKILSACQLTTTPFALWQCIIIINAKLKRKKEGGIMRVGERRRGQLMK